MSTLSPLIAHLALSTFHALPAKSKPRPHEWTTLSAIVLSSNLNTPSETLVCISLATGTKCLPASSIPRCNGTVLHDSHAEVLALRGFNRWLLAEMEWVLSGDRYVSPWVECRPQPLETSPASTPPAKPFILRPNISIHLFSTEAPCGDASMGLLINSTVQALGDASPWQEPAPRILATGTTPTPTLHGRSFFSLLGLVRRKPSRADAESTLSKSCTDKLTLKQVTSVLAWPASLFVQRTESAFLRSLMLPEGRFEEEGFSRAFSRLDGGCGKGDGGEKTEVDEKKESPARRFAILPFSPSHNLLTLTFPFSKPPPTPPSKASNLSALWVSGAGPQPSSPLLNETLLNGVKQGAKQWTDQPFKMSGVCRQRMWEAGRRVAGRLAERSQSTETMWERVRAARTYSEAKGDGPDSERRGVKEDAVRKLGGWVRNGGDAEWGL